MKKAILTSSLILINLIVSAQKKIEAGISLKHTDVQGTKLSIIPPPGFTQAADFFGFQQEESGSSIMVIDIPGPYSDISAGITHDNLIEKGIEVDDILELTINGLPATFVSGTQNAYGIVYTKFILVFGTSSETFIINGTSPQNSNTAAQDIKQSMLSVYYEEGRKINPLDALDYTIDVSGTKLKFGKSLSNSLIFSVDGEVPTSSGDRTSLVVAKSFSELIQDNKKQFSIDRLRQTHPKIDRVQHISEITIDGMAGYEISATAKNISPDNEESIYQVILFRDQHYYILQGMTNDRTGRSLEDIKKAIKTFRLKR